MADKHIADAEAAFVVVNITPDFCRVGKDIVAFDISRILHPEQGGYAKTVYARGEKVLMIDSVIQGVDGNAGQGVKSGVALGSGNSQVKAGAPTVFAEGRKIARHGDLVEMNGVF